jgi:hypothetical protein
MNWCIRRGVPGQAEFASRAAVANALKKIPAAGKGAG